MIIRDCYEKLYANKLDNIEEMGKFLETCSLPRTNYEKIENLTRLISSNKIEAVIKKLPTHKSPISASFTEEFYQILKEELIPILFKLFQNN